MKQIHSFVACRKRKQQEKKPSFSNLFYCFMVLIVLLSSFFLVTPSTGAVITVSLNLKVFLEGPYDNSGTMALGLNDGGFLPLSQPYGNTPWSYTGTETVIAIPNSDIVDWVLVELRDAPGDAATATGATVVARQAAFLLADGSVVDVDGSSPLQVDADINGNVFICVYHRNHLAVMSATPLLASDDVSSYDFTTSATKVYGGALGCKDLGGGVWGMVGGDGDADGNVNNQDRLDIWEPQVGLTGYYAGDYTLDGTVDATDRDNVQSLNSGRSTKVLDYGASTPQLTISAPSVVYEEDLFNVIVLSNSLPVESAIVRFASTAEVTDSSGTASFTAPLVTTGTVYSITAEKTGYLSASVDVTVRDSPESPLYGSVTGTVMARSGIPVSNAEVCLRIYTSDTTITRRCVLTDALGGFLIPDIESGSYSLQVSQEGYEVQARDITITAGEVTTVEVTLVEEASAVETIQDAIEAGTVGVKITLDSEDLLGKPVIDYFTESAYDVIVSSTDDGVTCTVTAEDGTAGTFVVFDLSIDLFAHPDGIQVSFDGQDIPQMTLEEFLHPEQLSDAAYLLMSTRGMAHIVVYVPHFSSHTIVIYTLEYIIEELSGTTAALIYIVCMLGIAIAAFVHLKLVWRR